MQRRSQLGVSVAWLLPSLDNGRVREKELRPLAKNIQVTTGSERNARQIGAAWVRSRAEGSGSA